MFWVWEIWAWKKELQRSNSNVGLGRERADVWALDKSRQTKEERAEMQDNTQSGEVKRIRSQKEDLERPHAGEGREGETER